MELNSSTFYFSKEVKIQLKTCINCGVVVEDNAVLFCPECGAGDLKEQPQALPEEECVSDRDTYYDDVLTELLNFYEVKAGECYFIPSGTIHANE